MLLISVETDTKADKVAIHNGEVRGEERVRVMANMLHTNIKLIWTYIYFSTDNTTSLVPILTASSVIGKAEPTQCRGNACDRCGKCYDWYYDGNIDRDYERFSRGESSEILNCERWHRRPDGPSVTCSYFYHYHYGSIGALFDLDISHCSAEIPLEKDSSRRKTYFDLYLLDAISLLPRCEITTMESFV